jgi:16S rRNA (adenine1518-N6/adenine1519-N6)-dimethyltransferase
VKNTSKKNLFFKIVRAGFSQPRKQIANNLSKMLKLDKEKVKNWLLKNGIEPSKRAETLSIEDWIKLVKSFRKS